MLCRIFGLDLSPETNPDHVRCTSLDLGQNLVKSNIKDLLIVALDIEGVDTGQLLGEGNFQIGLSILDTRCICSSSPEQYLLQSYNFCVGSPDYCTKAVRKFSFGQSEDAKIEELRTKIQELVVGRNIILVVHGGKYDVLFLKDIDIDLCPLYVLDTQKAAQHPLDLDHRCTLQELLILLKCPFGSLHVAGNEATFTLRALLLLVILNSSKESDLSDEQRRLFSTFETTAKIPPPLNRNQEEAEIFTQKRKEKRRNRLAKRARKKERKEKRKIEPNTYIDESYDDWSCLSVVFYDLTLGICGKGA